MADAPSTLDRAGIEALVPHAGAMCLLERVLHWDAASIDCATTTHADTANPLRVDGYLPIEAAIEYAAQAMAVHGGLGAGDGAAPRRGYVAVLNRVEWNGERLDTAGGELRVAAEMLQSGDDNRRYAFHVTGGEGTAVSGDCLVVLEAGG